ncbi:ATP-binding protein [Pectobacterium atrosepticum]|uniref:sensor histidine kinase n=1 Tax=Pectobacterium atrosepticum TaxID=29471 RepID=UPI00049AF8EE|nr:ATP-binding protein [Pectobacterium atrosepticum]GKV84291.1 two-component sensor histidine kinase [Pectobacterium carotovorum subsp. carotovorum]AIA71796.1 BaeS [Pectobacterium atrosepticum]AIK14754.1 histidine kinase [Pectobacterium atrosepticum]ATY91488.1 two-component sensor histidine kinase [Pectobacterium atrosepticum]KFX11265.1 BaeS [Pectobacterium atrosepticum]
MKKSIFLSEKMSLWRWLCFRIISLLLATLLIIATLMWLRFAINNVYVEQQMPDEVRAEFQQLSKQEDYGNPRYQQIINQYYGPDFFVPNIASTDWLVLAIMVLIALPTVVVIVLWRARPLSQQFSNIASAARDVAQGNFDARTQLVEQAPMELITLANDFNNMTAQLERYERELRESSAALAHELRTPLNAAMGRVQGMLDDVFPRDKSQLTMVIKQLEQLNHVIQDLHFLSLARAGQLQLVKTPLYFDEIVTERLTWYRPQLEQAGFQTHIHIEQHDFCVADRERLGQVFSILIENALSYASEGRYLAIEVREMTVREMAVRENVPCWQITVSDHGPGIEAESLPLLFDRFWRAEHSRGRHSGGSGLGLSIASAIITAHGGAIYAERGNNGGLAIVMTLPHTA